MHDLHAADKILNVVLEKAAEKNLIRVDRILIELGRVIEHGDEINPENLKFNIKMLAKQSPARDAEVAIKMVKGDSWKLVEIEGE